MRVGTKSTSARRTPSLGMTSMIDAVFLLLSYFLFTAGIALPEEQLSASAAASAARGSLAPQVVDVVIEGGQELFKLGVHRVSTRQQLQELLEGLPHDCPVVVRVHAGPTVAAAAAALQAAHDAGFAEVSYVPAP